MDESSKQRRKKIVVSGVGGIAGLLILAGAFAAGTLIRNIANKRRRTNTITKASISSVSSSTTEDGSEGLRSLLQTSSSPSVESPPRSSVEDDDDDHPQETPTVQVNGEKQISTCEDQTIDCDVVLEEDSSLPLKEREYDDDDDDGDEEEEEEDMEERNRDSSEGTGDSSVESNSETIWPAESVEEELLLLENRGHVQILRDGDDKQASKEVEGGFETMSSLEINKETGYKMIQSSSIISSRQLFLLWLAFAVGLLCLFFAHRRSIVDFSDSQLSSSL